MKVTLIGGGTGSSAVLNGLKKYEELDLNVIVSMADDGGSNAVLRDEFGLLPLSDIRKSIIALSTLERSDLLRDLFTYRFNQGEGLSGHTMGNLIMTALSKITGSEKEAINYMSEIFQVKGRVIPVTYDDCRLLANYSDGTTAESEHTIDEPEISEGATITEFRSIDKAQPNPDAIEAIETSNFIIIGPGDVYTTTLANFVVEGIAESYQKSKAKTIYVGNVMSKKGQTRGLTHSQVVQTVESYIGRQFDYVILNSEPVPAEVLRHYARSGEHMHRDDLDRENVIREKLIADEIFERDQGDTLVRSIIRHDSDKLGWILYRLMKEITLQS